MTAVIDGITARNVTTDRLTTRVLFSGPDDGVPVLFLHGNVSCATWWERTMLRMPEGYRGIAYDQRGCGKSTPAPEWRENTTRLLVEDINKLPFFMPLYAKVPVVPVIPHLFGTTVFREANWAIASYVVTAEKLIPSVFRDNRFIVISPSTRDDLVAREGFKAFNYYE